MARPSIFGTIVRRIELYCDARGSNKDYVITLTEVEGGCLVYTEYGPHGRLANGARETPSPISRLSASRMADNLIQEKCRKKGYRIVSDWETDDPAAREKVQPAKARPKRKKPTVKLAQLPDASRSRLSPMF